MKIAVTAIIFLMISGLIFNGCGAVSRLAGEGGDDEEENIDPNDHGPVGIRIFLSGQQAFAMPDNPQGEIDINTPIFFWPLVDFSREATGWQLIKVNTGEVIPLSLLDGKGIFQYYQPKFLKASTSYSANVMAGEKVLKQFKFSTGDLFSDNTYSGVLFEAGAVRVYPWGEQELVPVSAKIKAWIKKGSQADLRLELNGASVECSLPEIKGHNSEYNTINVYPITPLLPERWYDAFLASTGQEEISWRFKTRGD